MDILLLILLVSAAPMWLLHGLFAAVALVVLGLLAKRWGLLRWNPPTKESRRA